MLANEPSNYDSSYDWFTFYLRTTYVSIILTIWLMDQPKQCHKLLTKTLDLSKDNFQVNDFFVKIHSFIIFSTIIQFVINVRTNYLTHLVGAFEVILFVLLILANGTMYYYNFIRKKVIMANNDQEINITGSELQASMDEENNKKTIKIILWIITLVTIGKMIVSPSYIFYNNPQIMEKNPEIYLFLDNINNELFLYSLVLILFSQLLTNKEFFPISSLQFNSFDEFFKSLRNSFKIYVLNIIFLIFITSKTKSNYLFIVYILCLTTSSINVYISHKLLRQEGTLLYQPVNIDSAGENSNNSSFDVSRS